MEEQLTVAEIGLLNKLINKEVCIYGQTVKNMNALNDIQNKLNLQKRKIMVEYSVSRSS
ncbi:MAG: hypothetical protein AAFO99_15820 [Bacteroidota bacterium]